MTTRMPLPQRRAQLVDSALAVAVEDGIAAVTVRRVAERAGVALGVVHYCFADKDELISALAARIIADLTGAGADALVFDDPPDLPGALDAAVAALWGAIEGARGAQLLTYEITTHALRNPELRGVAGEQYAVTQRAAEQLLELVASAAGVTWARPVPELAGEALAYLDGVTLRWLADGDGAAARTRLAGFTGYLAGQAATQLRPRRERRDR